MKPYTRKEAREHCEYHTQNAGGADSVWCDVMAEAREYRRTGEIAKAKAAIRGARWIRRNLCKIPNGIQPRHKPFAWCVPLEGRSQ